MSNYGATYSGGSSTTYAGAGTYKPSNSEALTSMLGQMAVEPYNPQPVTTVNNTASSVEGIIGGLGQVAAAGVEIFGTDGALTPLAVIQGGQGILQIVQSIQALTGSGGGGLSVPTNTQVGCDLCSALDGIQTSVTGLGPQVSDVAQQVWEWQLPVTNERAEDDLALLVSSLVKSQAAGGVTWKYPNWAFEVVQLQANLITLNSPLVFLPDNILVGDTLLSYLTRDNPAWLVEEENLPGGMCVLISPNSTIMRCTVTPQQFDFMKYFMFTPSSGPPLLSTLGFINRIMSLIPVDW